MMSVGDIGDIVILTDDYKKQRPSRAHEILHVVGIRSRLHIVGCDWKTQLHCIHDRCVADTYLTVTEEGKNTKIDLINCPYLYIKKDRILTKLSKLINDIYIKEKNKIHKEK